MEIKKVLHIRYGGLSIKQFFGGLDDIVAQSQGIRPELNVLFSFWLPFFVRHSPNSITNVAPPYAPLPLARCGYCNRSPAEWKKIAPQGSGQNRPCGVASKPAI